MLRIDQVRRLPDETEAVLLRRCAKILRAPAEEYGAALCCAVPLTHGRG